MTDTQLPESLESWEITVDLSDAIDNDLEGWLDLISIRACGSDLLMEVDYKIIGITADGSIRLRVTGNPEAIEDENLDPD